MALYDVNFNEGDGQDFILEVPNNIYTGNFTDILIEDGGSEFLLSEIPGVEGGGGNIFIMSE